MIGGIGFLLKSILLLVLVCKVYGFPTVRQADPSPQETTYPNGTVVGKYAYIDKDGNPIHIKYYADDSSYGVEMNSLKVISGKKEESTTADKPKQHEQNSNDNNAFDLVAPLKIDLDSFENKDVQELNVKEKTTKLHHRGKYRHPDFEVYVKNDIPAAGNGCGGEKEKVHVYNYDNEKRRARNADEVKEAPEFCPRF